MSIMIKGAEMPKTCEECQSTLGLFAKECPLFAEFPKEFDYDPEIGNNRRYANCPLIEVPEPHGRLIDGDKLEDILSGLGDRVYRRTKGTIMDAQKFLSYAPTVIEAEEEEHEHID